MNRSRLALASLMAPMATPVLFLLLGLSMSGYPYAGAGHMEKFLFGEVLAVAALSYVASAVLGAPLLLALWALKRLTPWSCVCWSALAGGVAALAFTAWPSGVQVALLPAALSFACLGSVAALLTALLFCFLAGVSGRGA